MPAKKQPAKKTVSEKSEAPPPKLIDVSAELTEIKERLECLEKTVTAIRADFKSKGIPMP